MLQEPENCWEIEGCGRERGGAKVADLGECIASIEGVGHYCWIVAGTYCDGEIQGTRAQKLGACKNCNVYGLYNTETGINNPRLFELQISELASYSK